jgi:nitrile hydratase
VLKDFGTELPREVEIRVWDSSAEIRYLVIPRRPAGTEKMSVDELAAIVTRDSMVGVTNVASPSRNGESERQKRARK